MASDQIFVDFVIDQMHASNKVIYKKMFGEYGLYSEGQMFAMVCDNKLFIKPTDAGKIFMQNLVEAPPYPGAKPHFLIEEKLEDGDWLKKLVALTVSSLPEPKPKKEKAKWKA